MAPTDSFSPQEMAVLLTVLYSDVFDHALSEDQLRSYLVLEPVGDDWTRHLRRLEEHHLVRRNGMVVWKGRETLFDVRDERLPANQILWEGALRIGRHLAGIPFLRCVGVCGSLAADNAPPGADIDLFIVTEPKRLWIVQFLTMIAKRRAARQGLDICPNFFMTSEDLTIQPRTLHTAREIAHVVPLHGRVAYERFRDSNRWVEGFFPNLDSGDRLRFLESEDPGHPATEARLGGWVGDALNALLHRLLLSYYFVRLRLLGVRPAQILASYRRDRQEVVGGGYAAAIRERYLDLVRQRLGPPAVRLVEQSLFPLEAAPTSPVALYRELLASSYGGGS